MKTIAGQWPEVHDGNLMLQLERDHRISGGPVNAPRFYWFELGSAGEIPLNQRIWGNDELMPEGSRYRMTILDQFMSIIFGPLSFSLCGPSPVNLNRMIASQVSGGFNTFGIESANVFGAPDPGSLVLVYTSPFMQVFPANFSSPSSYATAGANAAAPAVFTVELNGAAVGTITFQPNGLVVFSTAGFTLNPGGRLTIRAPDPADFALSDVAITLVGTRLT